MSNSPLVSRVSISPNKTSPRNMPIDRITIHCYVGRVTAERGLRGFAKRERGASCNYVVGNDGEIGLCVEEKDRSWCSDSGANDHRAITFEVASDTTHPYAVTEAALRSVIDLCEDICRRYGKKKLLWFGDKDKTLSYKPAPDEMVLTVHRWFAAKACPGDYLYSRHGMIAEEVTKRLGGAVPQKPVEHPLPRKVKVISSGLNVRSGPGIEYKVNMTIRDQGVYTIVEEKNGWGRLKSGAGWISLCYTRDI